MASSSQTIGFQRVQTTAGTSVALSPQPYDNTVLVIFYNRGANPMLLGLGTAGGPISLDTSTTIPAGGSFTLPIGTLSQRPGPAFSGSHSLILDSVGGAGDAQITFLNQLTTTQ